jgi:hypothetical protein
MRRLFPRMGYEEARRTRDREEPPGAILRYNSRCTTMLLTRAIRETNIYSGNAQCSPLASRSQSGRAIPVSGSSSFIPETSSRCDDAQQRQHALRPNSDIDAVLSSPTPTAACSSSDGGFVPDDDPSENPIRTVLPRPFSDVSGDRRHRRRVRPPSRRRTFRRENGSSHCKLPNKSPDPKKRPTPVDWNR